MLFMRSTNNPVENLKYSFSYHQSSFKAGSIDWLEEGQSEISWVAYEFNCDIEDIEVGEDGYYVQVLPGLCGYALEAETLEEAINEIDNLYLEDMESINIDNIYIFEGKEIYSQYTIEGTLFRPSKILGKYTVER